MKKIVVVSGLFLILLGLSPKSYAQYYYYDTDYYDTDWIYELGGSMGIMNCFTDLGGKKGNGKPFIKDHNIGNTKFGGSAYLSALYKNKFAVRLEYTFGKIGAYDSILKPIKDNSGGRYYRNQNFRSKISEFSLIVELHPRFIFIDWPGRDEEPPRFSPYILAGIGYYTFNPQTNINNRWIDLQPLHTEGQGFAEYPSRKNYKLQQLSIPFGIGAKYELTRDFNLRAELVPRITFTDYLDDVSTRYINPTVFQNHLSGQALADALLVNDRRLPQPGVTINPKGGQRRGDPNDKDSYFTIMIKLGYTFGREKIR